MCTTLHRLCGVSYKFSKLYMNINITKISSSILLGIGYGQVFSVVILAGYYASLLALTVRYFVASFQSFLPWSVCEEEWGETCIDSTTTNVTHLLRSSNTTVRFATSAEFYF